MSDSPISAHLATVVNPNTRVPMSSQSVGHAEIARVANFYQNFKIYSGIMNAANSACKCVGIRTLKRAVLPV